LIAGGASAAPNRNNSQSNAYKLDARNADAAKQCIEKGGSVKDGMCVSSGGTPGTTKQKTICIVYKPGHEGDDRYCSQSVPAPN
jgi:hypothetical protein